MPYLDIVPFSIPFSVVGTAVNAAYPAMTRIATFKYNLDLGIIGYQFAGAVFVDNSGASVAFAAVLGQEDAALQISQYTKVIVSWFINGQTAVASDSSSFGYYSYLNNSGFKLPVNQPLSLYASAPNSAVYLLNGMLTIFTIPIKSS